ncbi:hypothetical protein HYU14_03845 [Candidatus Woesearchaeota archaeon]|nr:hypothetical protein [Candidatus Woesearchaeota archaeon]
MVRKIHTRFKRYHKISTHINAYKLLHFQKKKGARTFSTEAKAAEYAKSKGIARYTVEKVKKGKRVKIILG